jgi:hypothetical protein
VAISDEVPEPPASPQKQKDNRGPSDRKYEKKEREGAGRGGDRGGRGRGDKGRGEGRGRGRGDARPKDTASSAPTESVAAPSPEMKAKKEEEAALAKFQNAQEKMNKKEQKLRSQVYPPQPYFTSLTSRNQRKARDKL